MVLAVEPSIPLKKQFINQSEEAHPTNTLIGVTPIRPDTHKAENAGLRAITLKILKIEKQS
jgi:hypothetical protein